MRREEVRSMCRLLGVGVYARSSGGRVHLVAVSVVWFQLRSVGFSRWMSVESAVSQSVRRRGLGLASCWCELVGCPSVIGRG